MGVVTHASSPVEWSRPRRWPGHRRRNCGEDAESRHSAEPQRAPGFVQKVKCSHLYFPEETIVECPHGFCVDAHRHRMSSFAGKYESRLSLLEDVRLQRGAAASDPNSFRSGLLAGVNEKCSRKICLCLRACFRTCPTVWWGLQRHSMEFSVDKLVWSRMTASYFSLRLPLVLDCP